MKQVKTFTAKIYVGSKEGHDGPLHSYDEAKSILQHYCDEVSFCVTLDRTEFIYKNGGEPGFVVGIIHYPRFPTTEVDLRSKAETIAKLLARSFNQRGCSVVYPDETVWFEKEDLDEADDVPWDTETVAYNQLDRKRK